MRKILIGPLRKKVVLKINLKVRLNIFYRNHFYLDYVKNVEVGIKKAKLKKSFYFALLTGK